MRYFVSLLVWVKIWVVLACCCRSWQLSKTWLENEAVCRGWICINIKEKNIERKWRSRLRCYFWRSSVLITVFTSLLTWTRQGSEIYSGDYCFSSLFISFPKYISRLKKCKTNKQKNTCDILVSTTTSTISSIKRRELWRSANNSFINCIIYLLTPTIISVFL